MDEKDINNRLARCLGWIVVERDTFPAHSCTFWLDTKDRTIPKCAVSDFSPSTSVDALRKWVLPEIVNRGLHLHFARELVSRMHKKSSACDVLQMAMAEFLVEAMTEDASILAAAALAVLEEDSAR